MKIRPGKTAVKIIAAIILLFAIILFAAPRVAKWYIVKHSMDLIGRNIAIEKIRINYFTGTVRISGLKLFEADSKSVFLSFNNLAVNIDYLPLLRNEIMVRSISLADPYVQVLQNGSRFNFSDLTASDSTVAEKDTIPKKALRYAINNIRISRGYLTYTDVRMGHTIALDSLDLLIPGFTWNSDSTKLNVDFRFVDGGGLSSKLDLNQADSTFSVALKLDSLNLGIVEPYAKNYLTISSLKGFLSGDLLINGSMQSLLRLSVSGTGHIYGLSLNDSLDRTVLSCSDLAADIDTFNLEKNRLKLGKVTITDPFVLFELRDSSNNLMALMKPAPAPKADSLQAEPDTTAQASSFSYNLPPLSIVGGKVLIEDRNLSYPFEYTIDNLNVGCSETTGAPGKLAFTISAGLNGTGTIKSDGVLDLSNPDTDTDLSLQIGQFRMSDLDAYFKNYFGFPVTGGIMNFTTSNKLRPGSLVSDNSIFFRKFTLGQKLPGDTRYKVPLRLAVGILSDKDGVIDLKAPVRMKGEEVKVINLGRIIFRIIGNLFVKAAVSPFNLVSGLYNADPASLQEIKLGLSDAEPNTPNMKSLDIICDFLKNKPGVNADFIYCINTPGAKDTIAYLMAVKEYREANKTGQDNDQAVADTALVRYLLSRPALSELKASTRTDSLCRAYIGENRLTAAVDSLRNLQTGFLSTYISRDQQIASERFRVIASTPDTLVPKVKYPSFRIYFNAGPEPATP